MRRFLVLVVVLWGLPAPAAAAWSWPVDGPVLRPFALGDDPYAGGQHRGIDVGADPDAPVRAPIGGDVSFAGTVPGGGRTVTIRTVDGYSVTLLHLGQLGVHRGDTVAEGDAVAAVGPSGDPEWEQPYVHLGVRVTAEPHGYLDPLLFLPARPDAAVADASAPSPHSADEVAPAPAPLAGAADPAPVAVPGEPPTVTDGTVVDTTPAPVHPDASEETPPPTDGPAPARSPVPAEAPIAAQVPVPAGPAVRTAPVAGVAPAVPSAPAVPVLVPTPAATEAPGQLGSDPGASPAPVPAPAGEARDPGRAFEPVVPAQVATGPPAAEASPEGAFAAPVAATHVPAEPGTSDAAPAAGEPSAAVGPALAGDESPSSVSVRPGGAGPSTSRPAQAVPVVGLVGSRRAGRLVAPDERSGAGRPVVAARARVARTRAGHGAERPAVAGPARRPGDAAATPRPLAVGAGRSPDRGAVGAAVRDRATPAPGATRANRRSVGAAGAALAALLVAAAGAVVTTRRRRAEVGLPAPPARRRREPCPRRPRRGAATPRCGAVPGASDPFAELLRGPRSRPAPRRPVPGRPPRAVVVARRARRAAFAA